MALEPTGVQLQAKGFQEYLAQLKKIDVEQRKVFDAEFKGTDKSYKQIVQSAKAYENQLKREETAQAKSAAAAVKAADQKIKADERAAKSAQRAADQRIKAQEKELKAAQDAARKREADARQAAQGTLTAIVAIGAGIFELSKQAAQFESQRAGLSNLAQSYGQASGEIIQAMQKASNGVLSSSQIIQAANKALLLDVAKTPAEFEKITQTAIILGRTMGLTAAEGIDQFTTALGRRSLLILDNFGISGKQVNAEMEKLAQVQFGQAVSQLSEAQQNALFMAAALQVAERAAGNIGVESGKASESFERLAASSENLKLAVGSAFGDLGGFIADTLNSAFVTAQQLFAFIGAGAAGISDLLQQLNENAARINAGFTKGIGSGIGELFSAPEFDIDRSADEALEKFKDVARTFGTVFPEDMGKGVENATEAVEDNTQAVEDQNKALQAQQQIVRQAEQIQRSYTRALEDAARNQAKAQAKLGEQQKKARADLLKKQSKEFDKFQADALKDIQKLETDRGKEESKLRTDAAKQQVDDQRKLQQQLKQAEEQFNLSRLQSKRRFQLQDKRLQAEGDILGLQQLREDFALQQQEEKESFNLSNKQTKDSAAQQQLDQAQALDDQLKQLQANFEEQRTELTTGLDERRAELLTSFDEELVQLQLSQQEQRDELAKSYAEQLEDLRLSRQRQIEDLGASFVEQAGITQEGAQKIADELEKAFGEEGLADVIMAGFAERQSSSFQKLFEDIGAGIKEVGTATDTADAAGPTDISRRYPMGRLQSFDGGGVVPGPAGSPQPILAHGGERVLTMQQQQVLAPAVTSATFRHELAGSLTVRGSGSISDAQIDVISERVNRDVVESFKQGLDRVKRRNN